MKAKCPVCFSKVEVNIEINNNNVIQPMNLVKTEEDNDELFEYLLEYWRWCGEGKPEYRKEQFYYDSYHNNIKYLGDHKYSFNIQISGSDRSDTWWAGEFEYCHAVDGIKILNQKFSEHKHFGH